MTHGSVKTFHQRVIINTGGHTGGDAVLRSDAIQAAVGAVAEQAGVVGLQQRAVVGVDVALVAIRHVQVLNARLQRLGGPFCPDHRPFEHQLAVDLELRQYAVDRVIQRRCRCTLIAHTVVGGETVRNILLVVGRHQLGFGVQAGPAVGQRQVERWLHMQTGGVRAVRVDAGELGRLAVNMEIERAEVVL